MTILIIIVWILFGILGIIYFRRDMNKHLGVSNHITLLDIVGTPLLVLCGPIALVAIACIVGIDTASKIIVYEKRSK